jgi:hypothetical protein
MSVSKARSQLANEVKKIKKAGGDLSAESVHDAKRVLAEEKLKAYVEKVIAEAPALSAEARHGLELLLRAEK